MHGTNDKEARYKTLHRMLGDITTVKPLRNLLDETETYSPQVKIK